MNSAILITARLKSTRLPMKVIKPIMGRPMICHMIDRLKTAGIPEGIIICTSPLEQDDPLVETAFREGIFCYRGHPDDVLARLTGAAREFGLDRVISCTADNPFVDPVYIDRLLEFQSQHNYDYARVEGLPWGTFSYAVSRRAMERACEIKTNSDTEVWGGYFTETGEFSCGVLHVNDPDLFWPDLRLTVDTPEDFDLISRIFSELYSPGKIFSLREILQVCRRRPDLVAINSHVKQKPGLKISFKTSIYTGGRS